MPDGSIAAPGGRLPEGESPGVIRDHQTRGAFAELRRQRDEALERCVHLLAEVAGLRAEVASLKAATVGSPDSAKR